MEKAKVRILLASHNGSKYLGPMGDSVLAQDYQNIELVLSDDGSTDRSEEILCRYAAAYPETVIHYRAGKRFGNAQSHFLHLLQIFGDTPYIMFCDQDDIWHPDKIRKTLSLMQKTEGEEMTPALVHTDLRVVDEALREIAPSFMKHSGLDGTRMRLNQLLVQNVVTGCTVMINRKLSLMTCENLKTDEILMHDWWLALLAASCGRTAFLNEATVDYRQHGQNTVGAKDVRSPGYLYKRLISRSMGLSLKTAARQADAFAKCYENLLSQSQLRLLNMFSATREMPLWKRDRIYLQNGLLKYGAARIAAQLLGW